MPWISFPIANAIKKMYPDKSVLDYGAGKGFLIHALRLLEVEAYGYDISEYALSHCKTDVVEFLYNRKKAVPNVDVVFVKDALEHNSHDKIDGELTWLASKCHEACFIIPLGDNGRYRIADYHFDTTHIIAEDEEWWAKRFINAGFAIKEFYHKLNGFKDNWYSHHPFGNGIFLLERR